jgi:TonB-linked SusC/RagA family outer membrane protein
MRKNIIIKKMKHYFSIKQSLRLAVFAGMLFSGISLPAQNSREEAAELPQQRFATGKVIDAATLQPVIGAQVKIADAPASTMTNGNGEYNVKILSGKEVLIITAPDYAVREISLQGREKVDIWLYSDVFRSEYGNIGTLLGEKRKSTLVHSEEAVHDFTHSTAISVESDIEARLGGSVRAITRSGVPGMGASLFIRGLNSLHANAQPLIIVDGVIWDNQLNTSSVHQGFFNNPLAFIDLKDVESVTVIKDGNTLYGSKASNGVILINTVRGKSMVTKITANVLFGTNEKPRLLPVMNASQYRVYATDQVGAFTGPQYGWTNQEIASLPYLSDDPTKSYYNDFHNDSDWANEIFDNSMMQSYSVNVNGGDNIALYNLSMGYTSSGSAVKNTDMQRLNARFNSDVQLFPKMFTRVDISISQITRNLRDDGVNPVTAPGFISMVKAPILASHKYTPNTNAVSPNLSDYDEVNPYNPMSNPVSLIDNAMGLSTGFNFNLGINPHYQISNNVEANAVFGYRYNKLKESFFIPKAGISPQKVYNYLTENEVRDLAQFKESIFMDMRLDWKFNRNDNKFALTGGYRYLTDVFEADLPKGYNTGNDNVKVLLSNLFMNNVSGAYDQWKSISWYANAEYNYADKYILTASAGMDASSRFGKKTGSGLKFMDQSWAVFPSVGAAWIISSESFMKDIQAVNFLKLRAGYGLTGNDDIDNYAGRSYFTTVNYMGRAVGLELGNIQNEAIQWETSAKAGLGLDVSLFNERLDLSADIFDSRTKNLLTQKELKSITGLGYYWSNGGELRNQGYEFSFNTKLVNNASLKWELGAGIGHYKNEITALPDGDFTTAILGSSVLTAVGHPAGVFYGYKTAGVFATTAEAEQAAISKVNANGSLTPYAAGDIHFVEVLKDGKIDLTKNDDKQIIGDPNPDFYGTVSSRFRVKKLTLDVLFSYSYGNEVYNYLRSQLESGSTLYNQTTAMLNRWTAEGQVTGMPRAIYGDPMGNSVFSDRWIEDGSYLRLKTLTLSYDLPLNLSFLPQVTIWASANNLWTATKYLGSDPEFSMNNSVLFQGIDAGLTPQSRSYYLGIKINL